MDGECKKQEKSSQGQLGDSLPYVGNVLQPVWVRCPICDDHAVDRFLLDYGRYFLFPVGCFLWVVFLILQKT
jgi:hypothetical protein